jgi:sortase (surface protein transpeptidase)
MFDAIQLINSAAPAAAHRAVQMRSSTATALETLSRNASSHTSNHILAHLRQPAHAAPAGTNSTTKASPSVPATAPAPQPAAPAPVEAAAAPAPAEERTAHYTDPASKADLVVPAATFIQAPMLEESVNPPAAYEAKPGTDTIIAPVEPGEPVQPVTPDPVRIVAPSIGMDEPVISVGLDEFNMPIVPNHDPGWYNLSARPGQGENVVMWGHVLRFRYAPEIPAPFGRIKELTIGAPITVYTGDGVVHEYTVQEQLWVEPHQVEYILPQGTEKLTLVSCIGEYIIIDGSVENMTNRLITIAVPSGT